jgi:hypothetical protein
MRRLRRGRGLSADAHATVGARLLKKFRRHGLKHFQAKWIPVRVKKMR